MVERICGTSKFRAQSENVKEKRREYEKLTKINRSIWIVSSNSKEIKHMYNLWQLFSMTPIFHSSKHFHMVIF